MFTISKKTFEMAKKRGFELTLEEGLTSDGSLLLCFWEEDQDSEWLFSYQHTGHQLVWHGNVYAPKRVVAQLPKVIDDEYELREMICELAALTSKNYQQAVSNRRQSPRSARKIYAGWGCRAVDGITALSHIPYLSSDGCRIDIMDNVFSPKHEFHQPTDFSSHLSGGF